MKDRLITFEEKLSQSPAEAILVTGQKNVYYLTGFWGTAGTVFISKNRRLFLTDARYSLLARQTITDFDIIETRSALAEIVKIIKADKLSVIGFDSAITYSYYQELAATFADYRLLALTNFVEELRMIKDTDEIEAIRRACQISDRAFADVLDFIKPGQTSELDVANFLDFRMRKYGASGLSFETIVASGYRSAIPHGVAGDKVIQLGEMLTMDFGCYYNHYVSDMTRTIHIGVPTDEERTIYDIVLNSNRALIDILRPKMTRRDYDKAARDVIAAAGYGQAFTHGIGHGIGLDIHEIPYFGNVEGRIESGMVITDEPGIYLDGKYGVRIEDDLLVTKDGCEMLTLAPKELIILK